MPQMSPMSWLVIFSMLMILFMFTFNSFKPIMYPKTSTQKINSKQKQMKW